MDSANLCRLRECTRVRWGGPGSLLNNQQERFPARRDQSQNKTTSLRLSSRLKGGGGGNRGDWSLAHSGKKKKKVYTYTFIHTGGGTYKYVRWGGGLESDKL
jgi:hypothetical protein